MWSTLNLYRQSSKSFVIAKSDSTYAPFHRLAGTDFLDHSSSLMPLSSLLVLSHRRDGEDTGESGRASI